MFSASFTDLSVRVQTVAFSVLQEIFTGGGVDSKVRVPSLEDTHEGARVSGRNKYIYISKLKPRQFQVADLVMRKANPYQLENKLSPKCIGPFRVTEALGNGAYKLETLEGGAIRGTRPTLSFFSVELLHCT